MGSYTNADQESGDYSYRYSGANPSNYVCFDSTESPCPAENLYRIIGVFDDDKDGNYQIKLIKDSSYGNYVWDSDNVDFSSITSTNNQDNGYNVMQLSGILAVPDPGSNDWTTADLNYYLNNDDFFDTLNETWKNLIANESWQIGGGTEYNLVNSNAKTTYNYEVGTNATNTTYNAKIGLMYISDYYYAATSIYWSYSGYSSNGASYDYRAAMDDNWLLLGIAEWTISHRQDASNWDVFYIHGYGYIDTSRVYTRASVRPCFYLNSDVQYISGAGTESDPYRID